MAFGITPTKKDAFDLEYPNGFWNACMVETPLKDMLGTYYTERNTIWYDHHGFVGEVAFTEEEAMHMHAVLTDYVKTDDYANHRYFRDRTNQMEQFLEFLPQCGGFIKD